MILITYRYSRFPQHTAEAAASLPLELKFHHPLVLQPIHFTPEQVWGEKGFRVEGAETKNEVASSSSNGMTSHEQGDRTSHTSDITVHDGESSDDLLYKESEGFQKIKMLEAAARGRKKSGRTPKKERQRWLAVIPEGVEEEEEQEVSVTENSFSLHQNSLNDELEELGEAVAVFL